jgi:hypothetical protein
MQSVKGLQMQSRLLITCTFGSDRPKDQQQSGKSDERPGGTTPDLLHVRPDYLYAWTRELASRMSHIPFTAAERVLKCFDNAFLCLRRSRPWLFKSRNNVPLLSATVMELCSFEILIRHFDC